MSLLSNLIRWTPKILEASADDVAKFGPQAARVKALLNFIPGMSDDAAKISSAARHVARDKAWYKARNQAFAEAADGPREAAWDSARDAARGALRDDAREATWGAARADAWREALDASGTEVVSDLITPQVYRTLTNPLASARALDRLAGKAPESFIPIARDMGERGLVSAPADIVTALRISKLPQQQQSLVMGLVDSGMSLEDAMLAMRALS